MKKYIIGLFSAICLIGAGCTQFEDFDPVDMGEGPSVAVTLTKTDVNAFDMTITPGEGAVHYAYVITTEAMNLDADNLLQAKYDNAKLLKVAETPSVAESLTNQTIGSTYYVYAVAADERGLCGAIASASIELPDEEAPYIVDKSFLYTATNKGRTIKITFNENISRGEGAIEYSLNTVSSTGTFEPYKSGELANENVVISNESVTITLPEDAVFNETEGVVTYVFISMGEGAFQDASGNKTQAMQGLDADGVPLCPWWQYTPGASTTTGITIEIDETAGYGQYAFIATSVNPQYPNYADALMIYPGATVAQVTGQAFDYAYGLLGFGYCYSDDDSQFAIFGGDISEDGSTFNVQNSMGSDGYLHPSCDIPDGSGNRVSFFFIVGTYDAATNKVSMLQDTSIPFVSDATEPLKLTSDKVILCLVPETETSVACIDVLLDPYIIPFRLVQTASVARSFEPSINREIKANAIKAQVNSMKNLKIKSGFLRK